MSAAKGTLASSAFMGGGEMGKLIREKDWSQTPLGPIDTWPPSLLTTVSLVLNSNFPIALAWGPQHTQIYNDGYWPVCGAKHPVSMGQDFTECWASAFPVIGDAFRSALAGTTAYLEDQRMFLDRLGYLEETFFTFSFSPIRDESGEVVGLFHPASETTSKMVSQRRTRSLRDLTAVGLNATTFADSLRGCAQSLAEASFDVPFALFYQVNEQQHTAQLAAHTGMVPGLSASPAQIDLTLPDTTWPLSQTMQSHAPIHVDDVQARFPGLICGPYTEPIVAARVLPIVVPGREHPLGVLIVGVSTRLPMNQAYADFIELLGATVSSVAASALAAEAERRRAEALAEIDRAKTAFFANISHEFRTPLTLMLGPLEDELAASATLPAPHRERLELAQRNALRLLKLVNTLLDFSRIEAGRARANYQATDLATLTVDLAGLFRSAVERAGLNLSVECPPLPEPLFVDHEMWEKIVLNLLSNALKHTFSGGIRVALHTIGDAVELEVTDTGVGIPAAELPHLFERFHRVAGARSRTHEGTGIGLALVQGLAHLHAGSVRVTSTEGQGSTFTVSIPHGCKHLPQDQIGAATPAAANTAAAYLEEARHWIDDAPATPATVADASSPRPRILWADDNTDMRNYVSRLLSTDYAVTAVDNGEAAVTSALAQPPDLVLTDIMMPGLDGIGVLRALRADARTRLVPVILLSARAGVEESESGLAEGADDYLVKPFTARELLARVRTHLNLAKLRRESLLAQNLAHQAKFREDETQAQLAAAAESRRALLSLLEDQQQAEAASRLSRETLRMTLDAAEIGYWDLNLLTHAATRSLRHDQIFGYTELLPEWHYETFLAHVHAEDKARVDGLFQAGVAAKSAWDLECRMIRADQEERWIWVHGNVFTNELGEAVQMLGMVSDISARKEMEQAIVASEKEFRSLAEALPQIVWTTGADGLANYLNQRWVDYTGLSLEDSYGKGWTKPFHPDDQQRAWDAWQNAAKNWGEYALECRLRRADGVYRWWLIRGVPVLDEAGHIAKWFGTCTDIEDIKQNEYALRDKNAELESFTYMISHDLKSPLVTIRTFLTYLQQDMAKPDAARVTQDMDYIGSAALKMSRMLDELLEFSRVGKSKSDVAHIDWREAVAEALNLAAGALTDNNVQVEIADAMITLQGTRERLAQVWQNLIDNAVKFMGDQSAPRIRIGVEAQGKNTIFFVCDNGMGIEARYHAKIFGLFEKLNASAPGTGLGLALVKRIVAQYGGTILVESSGPGHGTCFRFTLPDAIVSASLGESS